MQAQEQPHSHIDVAQLDEAQLSLVRKQLRQMRKQSSGKRNRKTSLIDKMLKEKTHTTEDIWAELHKQELEPLDPATTKGSSRTRILKGIQARYQKLIKTGHDVATVRMVPAFARTSLDLNAILDWCVTASEDDLAKLREEIG